jgi:hypothetical protein
MFESSFFLSFFVFIEFFVAEPILLFIFSDQKKKKKDQEAWTDLYNVHYLGHMHRRISLSARILPIKKVQEGALRMPKELKKMTKPGVSEFATEVSLQASRW